MDTLGLIAGNGRFPFLLLDAARAHNLRVVVAAIKEETDPEIDARAAREPQHITVHWLSLGELSRLIDTFHAEGVTRAVMAGQVRHKQIFSSIRPDWRLAKLLLNLRTRNTDMLLGAVAKVLEDEGITLLSSTAFLEPMLAPAGVLTARAPSDAERADIDYGLPIARGIAAFDLGQTIVIAAQACVAVEAMEGTDATIARAGDLMRSLHDSSVDPISHDPVISTEAATPRSGEIGVPDQLAGWGGEIRSSMESLTLARRLTVIKVAKPNQDLRFDVPVAGPPTIEAMRSAGATCLCVEAGRTLLFDRDAMTAAADRAGITILAEPAPVLTASSAAAPRA